MPTGYLENADEKLALQLENFGSKVGIYATQFGLSATEILNCKADAAFFLWVVKCHLMVNTNKKNWTQFKNISRKGDSNLATITFPTAQMLEAAPVVVAPGIAYRFTTMVNRIKAHQNYTRSIGQNLGVEKSPAAPIDKEHAQPTLKVVLQGGKVNLLWKKGRFTGILIAKDIGKGFAMLDRDFTPHFVDNSPMPAVGESAIWNYRASYLINNDLVGVWSDMVSITVAG